MKTLTHTTQIIKITFLSAFLFFFITASALGNNDKAKKGDKSKTEMVEEAQLAQEVMDSFDEEVLELMVELKDEASFQIVDQNDQVIFSGNEQAWNDQTNMELAITKRKVEFLFELNGAKIYKMF